MPFDRNPDTGKLQFSFTNLLALVVVLIAGTYFYWISFILTKTEVKDNSSLQQITIVMVTIITLVLNYYFGNSNNSAKQAQQITEMQKTALTTANTNLAAANNTATPEKVEIKIDKAVKLAELKAELEKHPPDTEEAKRLLDEIAALEKSDK